MEGNLRKELIKEYEMLFNESMKKIKENKLKFTKDEIEEVELIEMYMNVLKAYTCHNHEEGQQQIDLFLDKIIEIKKIEMINFKEKVTNNLHEMIKQEVIKLDTKIEDHLHIKLYYISKLADKNCTNKRICEIKKELDNLTNSEINILKKFVSNISRTIDSEMNRKSFWKRMLIKIHDIAKTAFEFVISTYKIIFVDELLYKIIKNLRTKDILKKMPIVGFEVGGLLFLKWDLIEKIRQNKGKKDTEKILDAKKEHIHCIYNSKQKNNDIRLNKDM